MRKTWLSDVIGTEKAAIGLVHLLPLPTDPLYDDAGGIKKIYEAAKADVIALQDGGIDAIQFANEFSFPYQPQVTMEVVASMAMVIGCLKDILRVPYGANVISDSDATLALCAAVNASFTRGTFSGCYAGNSGFVNKQVGSYIRKRHDLRMDQLKMVHYALPESNHDIADRSLLDAAYSSLNRNLADAIGIAGASAGKAVDLNTVKELRSAMPDAVLFATTGVTYDSLTDIYNLCDGAFIATHFKVDGIFQNPIDEKRVKRFMEKLRELRKAI